ncbi:hypothetical protein TRIP_E230098 [uncultured Spirochaetota bacterium]|nr:hypothetical protein TRIP_E230098 [uncultured Spirochaetota bacterium]
MCGFIGQLYRQSIYFPSFVVSGLAFSVRVLWRTMALPSPRLRFPGFTVPASYNRHTVLDCETIRYVSRLYVTACKRMLSSIVDRSSMYYPCMK